MNLLLYTEARKKLARHPGKPTVAEPDCPWGDMDAALPDDLFAELGYFGALDTDEAGTDATDDARPDSEFDSLFAAFAEPVFSALH